MRTLFVVSSERGAGKTALITGIARRLRRDGLRVSYFKPVSPGARSPAAAGVAPGATRQAPPQDEDAAFLKAVLGLTAPVDRLAPVRLGNPGEAPAARSGQAADEAKGSSLRDTIKAAYLDLSREADVVLAEGAGDWRSAPAEGLRAEQIAELLDAQVLLVTRGRGERVWQEADDARQRFGDRLAGMVLNLVSPRRLAWTLKQIVPALGARGVPVLGVLPVERFLFAVTAAELARHLGGRIVTAPDCADVLVEELMVGTMSLDFATDYFHRKQNKAVITALKKPEIQFGALNTSTRCLIVGGRGSLSPVVTARAEELGVPTIISPRDTFATIEAVEEAFGQASFRQSQKLDRLDALLDERLDYAALGRLVRVDEGRRTKDEGR